jgi:hypothetical protein
VSDGVVKIAERTTLVVEVGVDLLLLDDRPVFVFVLDDVPVDVEALSVGVVFEEIRIFGEDLHSLIFVAVANVRGVVFR